jgi:hypothetical protein
MRGHASRAHQLQCLWVRILFDRSRMFAFSSRISLANRWPKHWETRLVRDEGVAGSNPATPTNFSTHERIGSREPSTAVIVVSRERIGRC